MSQGFDEFYNKYYNLDGYEHHYKEFYKAGAASRQAEIDELQKRLDMYERQDYKLVPVEPTEEIIDAGENELWYRNGSAYSVYKAMIGAVE